MIPPLLILALILLQMEDTQTKAMAAADGRVIELPLLEAIEA